MMSIPGCYSSAPTRTTPGVALHLAARRSGMPKGRQAEGGAMAMQMPYPVQFSVDYPDRQLNRLTSAFRIFVAIPILIVLGSVSGPTWTVYSHRATYVASGAGGLLFFGPLLLILFRQKGSEERRV